MKKEVKKEEAQKQDLNLNEDLKALVKARLSVLPKDVCVSVGSNGETYNRDDLISHVEEGDAIGKKIIEIDMEFLRALKNGEFYGQTAFNN